MTIFATAVGRLGADPERVRGAKGDFLKFSVATRDNANPEKAVWVNCIVFEERLGKLLERHFRKGSAVVVMGTLQLNSYVNRDGESKVSLQLVVTSFTFAPGSGAENKQSGDSAEPSEPTDDIDIPF